MAGKPRNRSVSVILGKLLCWVCLLCLSGCEVGGTMFQYSSGSSPFLGIDLIPRKRASTTRIKHEGAIEAPSVQKAEIQLTKQNELPASQYHKQPLRLNLPPSSNPLPDNPAAPTVDVDFSVASFADRAF